VHERRVSEWGIIEFLNECNLESLEIIMNTEKGQRRKKAVELFNLYKMASIRKNFLVGGLGSRPDKKRAAKRNDAYSSTKIHIYQPTVNGSMNESLNGDISGNTFHVNVEPRSNNREMNDGKILKKVKIDDYFSVRSSTSQDEQGEHANQ
ncbi:34772_t:CDS:2, partial [Racocetra persica]